MPRRPLDPAACPGCGGDLRRWRSVPSSEPALGPAVFVLWRCDACGTAVTAGELAPGLHATGAYSRSVPRLHRLARPVVSVFLRERLGLLGAVASPGASVIDAGAGQGRFVVAARAAGYTVRGFDPHPRAPEVVMGGLQDVDIAAGSADAVTLWHVLEHVDDPGAALERARTWLAPGGALVVAVPNLDSWQARLGGSRWFHLDVPRHRTHFTPAGIRRLLDRHGFVVNTIEHRLLEHNPFGLWQSALNRIGGHPSWLFSLLKGNARWDWVQALLCAVALPFIPVAVLAERLAGMRRRGGTIVVLARRRDEGLA